MKTINKQPKIRFKGYTDEWQQRKLGEIAEIIMGQSPKGENYTENPDDHILVQGNADMKNGRVVPRVWTTQITKQANPEDIILSVRAPVGDVGKTDFNVVLGRGVAAIKGNEFIYQNLKKMKETGFWTRFSTGSTFESINSTDLKDALLLLPSNEEQIEIGNFFKQLDDTIALHQRKLEALEKTKKSFLQKMFPKKDETKPEIRFAGFTDDWEQRKLGEVFNQTVEYVDPKEVNLELWSVTVEKGLTPKTERYNREALVKKNDKFKVVHPGDIVYNPMNMTIGSVGFNKTNQTVAVSGYYVTMNMNSGFSNSYFNTWLPSAQAIKVYKLYATGSLVEKQRIQFPTLSSIRIQIPTFEEQERIGQFFESLNTTIALHQRQLEVLKNMKTSFLQKMYI